MVAHENTSEGFFKIDLMEVETLSLLWVVLFPGLGSLGYQIIGKGRLFLDIDRFIYFLFLLLGVM